MTDIKRVKINDILESQIPEFLNEESPLFRTFLKTYYNSLDHKSGAIDLSDNIKFYKSIEAFNNADLTQNTTLVGDVYISDTTINVDSTIGWPEKYGLLKINNEIITYTEKTNTSFLGCIRGFSGIDRIKSFQNSEFLDFTKTESEEHSDGDTVFNLSNLFLSEFFEKFKYEFLPGFESRTFYEGISTENVLTRIKDFYRSKGTDSSYEILFKILYGKNIQIIKPQDYTLVPSSNSYFTTKNILVEKISGDDPTQTKGNFLYQNISGVGTVSASIYNVEFRPINNKPFYEISLDSTSFSGVFEVSGKTKLLEYTPAGSNSILVDSTIGFSKSGKLLVRLRDSSFVQITYADTTTNQFLGVNGITKDLDFGLDIVEEKFAFSYIGVGNTSKVDFRVVNVIDSIDFSQTSNLRVGDKIRLSGFGKDLSSSFQFNSWIYNIPTNHNIRNISQIDSNKYRVVTYDQVSYYKGQTLKLEDNLENTSTAIILDVEYPTGDILRKYSDRILVQVLDSNSNLLNSKVVKTVINKASHYLNDFSYISNIPSGVQNTYIDFSNENLYVTSTGFPNYTINVDDTKTPISVVGTSSTSLINTTNHKFVTGDAIYYNPSNANSVGVSTGFYFVTKVDNNNIRLSYSKSDLFSKKYININPFQPGNDFIYKSGYENKVLGNQKLFKKFDLTGRKTIFDDKNKRSTNNKQIGLLVNGVELLSPTLFDENIYYGKLESIQVTNSGRDYDVINVPEIVVEDELGSNAKAHLNLTGEVKSIKVINPGIGYQTKPKITISGGNGSGCVLESNLVKSRLTVGFRPRITVNIGSNLFTFNSNHNFVDGEEIIYDSKGNDNIGGLVSDSHYFVGITSTNSLKLYNTFIDAINKTNEINLTSTSSGFHSLDSLKSKNTITKVYVKDPGRGFSNRAVRVPSQLTVGKTVGINTFDSYIFATSHGFNDGELVTYNHTGTAISGLSTDTNYYIKVLDSNRFKLSVAGIGSSVSRENFINKKYVKFNNTGVGTHIISYPPITINVETISEIGDTEIVQPILQPIVLGSISDVYLEDGGLGYGCTDIINFHRRPNVSIKSITSECILKPIIVNGSIVDVKIINNGRGYRVDSDIIISGSGSFAEIDPVIVDGRVTGVNVLRGGVGYASSNTVLTVVNRGSDAKFLANVTEWKINQVVKLANFISPEDDGVLFPSKNPTLGLQFTNFYAPKKLRYQLEDNFTENNKETSSDKIHSPILGFAYDGFPIYGPYGYDPLVGGSIRRMTTGYELDPDINFGIRPPEYVPGYFVNDYVYKGSGDLDEYNGRWCKTPQYPNGTYAYFISIDVDATNQSYPIYPYVVGKYFRGTPIEDNFLPKINQDSDISKYKITRNVGPYYLNYSNSSYELIDKIFDTYKQEFRIKEIQTSGIEEVSVFSPGNNYKVNDRLDLDNTESYGSGANIVVESIKGREIADFVVNNDIIENSSFIIQKNKVVVRTSDPHNILDGETISLSGISTYSAFELEGDRTVFVKNKSVELSENITTAVSGVTTFISVKDISGFEVNDVIGIGTEILRIVNISKSRSGFYVNRISNPGIHTVGIDNVRLLPTSFEFLPDKPLSENTIDNFVTFFDPKETVGTGVAGTTRYIVGIGTSTIEERVLPPRSIYIPGHKFYTGQPLLYGPGLAGTSLYVNNVGSATSIALLDGQVVYAVNLGKDYIGLSTLGFTSTTGIGSTFRSLEFRDFDSSFGLVGSAQSLTTLYPKITGTVERYNAVVTTTEDHNLTNNDLVDFTINNKELVTTKILYNPEIRKLVTDKIEFLDTDISTSDNTISVGSSVFKTGDKVVYVTETSVVGGLENNGVYHILRTDFDKIKLCEYESDIEISNEINITSSGGPSHGLYLINPPLNFTAGDTIKFDLSDESLLQMDLEFYEDPDFQNKVEVIGNDIDNFVISRSVEFPGQPGSNVTLDSSNKLYPKLLYYNLVPKNPTDSRKNEITTDIEVIGNNKLTVTENSLNNKYRVLVVDDSSFTFNLKKKPSFDEKLAYNSTNRELSYFTTSKNALGPINSLKINFSGRGYVKLPSIRNIISENGKDAVLKLTSSKVGRVESYERVKDGFDYPTDPTLSPSLSVPTVVGIKDIRTIDYVGIITGGRGYNTAPTLFVKDDPSIKLKASITGGSITKVDILQNSISLSAPLEIYSIYNSNGYDIDFISVVGSNVTLELLDTDLLNVGFGSTAVVFPFQAGDEIFVEGCRLTENTKSAANFNSSSYDYAYFTLTSVDVNNKTITYSMSGISTGSFGTYDDTITLGRVINKKDIAEFQMILKDDVSYLSGERVTSRNFSGYVMENGWDNNLNQLRINDSVGDLIVGDRIYGENSKINGVVEYFDTFNLDSTLGVSRDKIGLLDNAVGILNDFQQRLSDNFYYQKFSYSIKSEIPYNVWRESVRSLVHPSGFKEFSDFELVTEPSLNEIQVGISKSTNLKPSVLDSTSNFLVNIDNTISLNERSNFNLVYEEDFLDDGSVEKVFFNEGVALRNFIVNKTNKVIKIDDIGDQFNGTTIQSLRGRYADASDLLDLNKEFIQEEVVAFVEYNYPNIGLSTTYDATKCKRDVGYIVDAISHDIKYNSNNKSIEAGLAYWDAGSSYVVNETEETLFAYNYVKFLGQYIINNQTPPTLYQSTVSQQFNFDLIQDPTNVDLYRYKDARNLIVANKREILDKSLASVAIGFPDFYFPGDAQTNSRSRYYDGYRLIQQNRQEIIDTAWANTLSVYPGISTTQSKCKRDIGYFVDAVSTDVFTGGNNYSKQFVLQYFSGGTPISNGLVGEESESIFAFESARDLMRSAVRNGLTVKDLTVTPGQAIAGIGTTVPNTSPSACTDVQNTITSLTSIVTTVIGVGNTSSLPATNVGTYTTGGNKCFRDLGYIVDAVAQDIAYGTNQHIIYSTKKYFTGAGAALTTGLLGEESESIYAFESAKNYMKLAITNQLNVKDLTITADPLTGFNTSPNSCANVQTNIDNLVGILTVAIGSSSLSGIPTESYGTTDCADVRTAIGNYVGIITTIIGFGTASAPTEITYPSLTKGGITVGLTTFKLTSNGDPLFKREFDASDDSIIELVTDSFIFNNHNFQSGQELIYNYSGTPIGIATTSYVSGDKDILMQVDNYNGTAIYENGYGSGITTTITGVSTVIVPAGPTNQLFNDVVGTSTSGGTNAIFDVLITYSSGTGQPLSTSISLVSGGEGFSVGETVSIAGTYFKGSTPANDLSFVISATAPTVIQTESNQQYLDVPSEDMSGALFNVSRDNNGIIDSVIVVNGGAGYAITSVVSIAGSYLGGSTPNDTITFTPTLLGTNKLPKSVFVYKLDDSKFKLSGFSTSIFFNITGLGTGIHSLEYKDPNSSSIITIDGIIQTQVRRKSLSVTLGSPVSTASTTFIQISSGISSLNSGDIINLNSEYLVIKNIGVAGTDIVEVERAYLGTVSGVHTVGTSATILSGDYNIVGDVIYFTTAPYGKIGPVGLETGSIFSGRVFSRQFDPSTPEDKNIILDDISLAFTGIAATEFTAKSEGNTTTTLYNDVNSGTDINNNPVVLINNVFQHPRNNFTIDGTSENVIKFLSGTPSAGKISKVGVNTGFGYSRLLGASAIANVSAAGTISSLTLTGAGSGYRGAPVVSVSSTIGTGASITATVGAGGTITGFVIVNPGSGYTTTSLPEVNIGIPTAYSNLGVAYTGGSSGVGQGAKVSVTVGQGSSIIDYKIDNPGLGYKVGDILKVQNLVTNPGLSTVFEEFVLTVQEVQTDKFTGFYPGQFVVFDDFSSKFNGFRRKFTLTVTNNNVQEILSLKTLPGSDINLQNNIFIYINDVLQSPGDAYTFSGSRVSFTEAPKPDSTCTVLYYRGSSIDVEEISPIPTIKEGDTIIIKENESDLFDTDQLERVVKKITASDQLDTFAYNSVGIITDPNKNRPLTWIKQEYDRIINGQLLSKARQNLSSNIRPTSKLIKSVSESDSVIYVDNAFPLFTDIDLLNEDRRDILISEVIELSPAICTSIVSSSSTVSSINIVDGGVGYAYTQNPVVNISKSYLTKKDPIKDWKYSTGISTSYDLNSVTHGNVLVTVGSSSIYATSSTGESWDTGSIGFGGTITFNSVSCASTNVFVSVGENGIIARSFGYSNTVGVWTSLTLLEENVIPGLGIINRFPSTYTGTFNDISYSNNLDSWAAVGTGGSIFASVGIESSFFISRFSGTLQDINSLTSSPFGFVAVGDNGVIISSINSIVWDNNNSPTTNNLNKVIYSNGFYIIAGDSGTILKGVNPGTMQVVPTNISENIIDIYYDDLYVALTSIGNLYYSLNLSDWIYRDTNQPNNLKEIIRVSSLGDEGRYIAVGAAGTSIYSDPIFNRATAVGYVSSGILTSVQILNGGFGYDENNPPPVLVEPETGITELVKSFKVIGDFGTIIGINTFVAGTPGIGTTSPKVEFVLKSENYDNSTLGIGYSSLNNLGVSYSQLSKGDYFIIADSNVTVGHALTGITTSLGGMSNYPNSVVGTAYTYLDGVYRVEDVTSPSSGIVTVSCNFAPIESPGGNYIEVYSRGENNTGFNTNGFYGRYSWSKIFDYQNRILGNPQSFTVNTSNGLIGLSTSPQVTRTLSV